MRLDALGVDGLVIFNRFYQPDIDVETLDVVPTVRLSDSSELLLRLRWLAILSGRIRASLAVTGGVHTASRRRQGGHGGRPRRPDGLGAPEARPRAPRRWSSPEMREWLEEHGYESLRQMQGSMSLVKSADPAALERSNYMRVLQSWPRAQEGN